MKLGEEANLISSVRLKEDFKANSGKMVKLPSISLRPLDEAEQSLLSSY